MLPSDDPEALRAQLAAIVEHADDAILSKTLDGVITSWNHAAELLYGYTAAEAIGQPVTLIIPLELPDEFPGIMARLQRGEQIERYVTVRQHKDGQRLEVLVSISPLRNAAGEIVGASAVARDVGTRRRERQELAALQAAREESAQRLELAAQITGFGVYDDAGPGHVYWSPELKALFGLPPDFSTKEGVATALRFIHPDDQERWRAALERARDPAGTGELVVEHRLVRPDGSTIWVAQHGRILFAGEGVERRAVRAIGIVQDITERKQREAGRDAFITILTHDLKSPLTATQGSAQLLQRRLERQGSVEPERLAEGLKRIQAGTGRAVQMLNELLDLARVGSGQPLALERVDCDLVALARTVVASYQPGGRAQQLTLHSDEATLSGPWDAARLERVLGNLVGNALKYSPEGGAVTVTVARDVAAAQAVLRVEDQGLGIPAEDLPQLFRAFQRGSNVVGQIPGAGIGLLSAKQLVEQHGGSIVVESRLGVGSCFTVRLPLTPSNDTAP
jgi:PAS domain S-box-containing protein